MAILQFFCAAAARLTRSVSLRLTLSRGAPSYSIRPETLAISRVYSILGSKN